MSNNGKRRSRLRFDPTARSRSDYQELEIMTILAGPPNGPWWSTTFISPSFRFSLLEKHAPFFFLIPTRPDIRVLGSPGVGISSLAVTTPYFCFVACRSLQCLSRKPSSGPSGGSTSLLKFVGMCRSWLRWPSYGGETENRRDPRIRR